MYQRPLEMSANLQIATQLKSWRELSRLSQAEVAVLTGLTQAGIAKLEAGTANPTIETLDKLAQAMMKPMVVKFARH